MNGGAWIAVAALAGLGGGAFIGWMARAGDQSLTDMTLANVEADRADRLERLVRLIGATDRDLDDLNRGVLVADVAETIQKRAGS